jgi:DNA invertase Pin-like site-specific DNA recombinase
LRNVDRLRPRLNQRTGNRRTVTALKAAECERIYREKASCGRWDQPELHRLLDQLRKGDVLVVWKLDRLSRSLRDVLTIMETLAEAKAGFRSLTEAIDTTTPAGRMMMHKKGQGATRAACHFRNYLA